jgi:Fur family ferric uptake transcriptional regulator
MATRPTEVQIFDRLRERGIRLTRQRRAIIGALVKARGGSFNPKDLVRILEDKVVRVGLTSIYRTLDLLVHAGILQTIHPRGAGAHGYLLCDPTHHHHMVCSECTRVIEVKDCGLEAMAKRLSRANGFRVEGHHLEWFGRCRVCSG